MKMNVSNLKMVLLILLKKEKQKLPWKKSNCKLIVYLTKLYTDLKKNNNNNKVVRSKWVSEIYTDEMRILQGASHNLLEEMRLFDKEAFYNFVRMPADLFDKLLAIVGPFITKSYGVRVPIPAKTRLELTLRFLATGDSMTTLGCLFRISKSSVSTIIAETCDVIWDKLKFMVFPELSQERWKEIAEDFSNLWNFPHCVGAVDGKLVKVQVKFYIMLYYFLKEFL